MSEKLHKLNNNLATGFIQGLGWAFGATIGFALLITLVAFLFKQFGHLPLVGGWFNWAGETIQETSPTKLKKELTK